MELKAENLEGIGGAHSYNLKLEFVGKKWNLPLLGSRINSAEPLCPCQAVEIVIKSRLCVQKYFATNDTPFHHQGAGP